MTDGDTNVGGDQKVDQLERGGNLWRKRDQPDATVGCVLATLEIIDAGRRDVLARVGAARPILRGDVRSLHVDSGD